MSDTKIQWHPGFISAMDLELRENRKSDKAGQPGCLDISKMMVRNNIEVDVKVKCIENGTTQKQVAENIDTTKSYVNRVIKKRDGVVNHTFVRVMEALGYDIELHYVKREDS